MGNGERREGEEVGRNGQMVSVFVASESDIRRRKDER